MFAALPAGFEAAEGEGFVSITKEYYCEPEEVWRLIDSLIQSGVERIEVKKSRHKDSGRFMCAYGVTAEFQGDEKKN